MSYQALYRKYRPKKFSEIFGQDENTKVLKTQIADETFGHAYLFTGTRGTGKTSTAKIFSRAINCKEAVNGEPCNKCDNCLGILEEKILDVIEMDAASNNSVDDIRDLKEKAKYLPSKTKYKVYIIDEVHMLSKEAFNALLKILEEPPKHLVFILATTEPHKLPATILSRCQRFDFKRIGISKIVECLSKTCEDMDVDIEKKALEQIAILAEGAMRDAMSLLERCIYSDEDIITYKSIINNLGLSDEDIYESYAKSIGEKNIGEIIDWIEKAYINGTDFSNLTVGLVKYFRNLLLMKVDAKTEEMSYWSKEKKEKINENLKYFDETEIKKIILKLSDVVQKMKYSKSERLLLECMSLDIIDFLSMEKVSFIKREQVQQNKSYSKNEIVSKTTASNLDETKMEKAIVKENDNNQNSHSKNKYDEISGDEVHSKWEQFMEYVKQNNISLHALLKEGKINKCLDGKVEIIYPEGFAFHKQAIDRKEKKIYLENLFSKFYSKNVVFLFSLGDRAVKNESNDEIEMDFKTKFHGAEIEIE